MPRQCLGASCDTFKKFREWLDVIFKNNSPTDEEWDVIMDEYEQYQYHVETLNKHDCTQEGSLNFVGMRGGA